MTLRHLRACHLQQPGFERWLEAKAPVVCFALQTQALLEHGAGQLAISHKQKPGLQHPGYQYTISTHQTSHGVVYQTARTDLLDLQSRGLLRGTRRGRKWFFTAPTDLETRLAV